MPEMTGIEFLEKVITDFPECIRMIITGYSDVDAIIQAINTGSVYRYITKPWNREELKINIDNAIEIYRLKEENKKLIEDLKEYNLNLEKKVIERTQKIEAQNREITCSIQYASKIQNALMPREEDMAKLLKSFFVLNKPRDIVSGDYYWVSEKEEKIIIAVADCTGHGVPGAFMSILGVTFLNEIVNRTVNISAGEILNQLRSRIMKSLRQTGKGCESRDGMEMALCVIDSGNNKLQFSGAFRPMYIISEGAMSEYSGDNMPIGYYEEVDDSFNNRQLSVKRGDVIYLFTDGYPDQIGGIEKKTFRSQNFRKLLLDNHTLPMVQQKELLEKVFSEWKGDNEQIDDILVIGIKF
jgi:serine phosphatase RsbU (regulator of sigma subunit)